MESACFAVYANVRGYSVICKPKPPSDEGGGFFPEGEKLKKYNKDNIPLAKNLRKNMTPWERKLWYDFLRNYPVRFQRQKAIGNYIVDFYCAKAGLVIELDGGGHYTAEQMKKDHVRTNELDHGFNYIENLQFGY